MNKEEAKVKALKVLPNRFNVLNLCALYRYLSIKSQISSRGYDLSSQDRELVFIDIITKNNPEEIAILEKYLEVYDVAQESISLLRMFEDYHESLETSEDRGNTLNAFLKTFS